MTISRGWAAAAAVVAMLAGMPAQASEMGSAEKLRRLDIMLMVTGLRCRAGEDDFQADFQRFDANHMAELNQANADLREGLARRLGTRAADAALDRISTSMANQYGQGHPWLGCRELKGLAIDLADEAGSAPLLAAADQLLTGDEPARVALAGR